MKNRLFGVWIATVSNLDFPSKPTLDTAELESQVEACLDKCTEAGINAVFLQVRPCADAIYPSKLFPWSKYLTGRQGVSPKNGFDPLAYFCNETRKRGIELHAWVNPYRITKHKPVDPGDTLTQLHPDHPAVKQPDWVVKHNDGSLYFNPAITGVRELIVNGVIEILDNYPVAGIHFDDRFYPSRNFNDRKDFEKYKNQYENIDDFRRDNVNKLIEEISTTVKSRNKAVKFGVSPLGVWANRCCHPLGSDSKEKQSFYDNFADVIKWIEKEWIDYVIPQLYWHIGYEKADYAHMLEWWSDKVRDTRVKLYIGHGTYLPEKAENPGEPVLDSGELELQLKMNSNNPQVCGSVFFRMQSLVDKPELLQKIKECSKKER